MNYNPYIIDFGAYNDPDAIPVEIKIQSAGIEEDGRAFAYVVAIYDDPITGRPLKDEQKAESNLPVRLSDILGWLNKVVTERAGTISKEIGKPIKFTVPFFWDEI